MTIGSAAAASLAILEVPLEEDSRADICDLVEVTLADPSTVQRAKVLAVTTE